MGSQVNRQFLILGICDMTYLTYMISELFDRITDT